MKLPTIIETADVERANELLKSEEFCQPIWSESRRIYILIRKVRK